MWVRRRWRGSWSRWGVDGWMDGNGEGNGSGRGGEENRRGEESRVEWSGVRQGKEKSRPSLHWVDCV